MSTSTVIAISCLIALITLNFLIPAITTEFEGASTEYDTDEITNPSINLNDTKPSLLGGTYDFIKGLWGFFVTLVKIIVWNWEFNIYINLILSFLKVALVISVLEIVLP